jgi:rhamnosyl/mannosyltransferase
MSTLRVLHLGKYYTPDRGGIETVVETLCRGERPAVETQALVLNKANQTTAEVLDDIPVRRVRSIATVGSVSVAPSLPMWLSRADADVIVLHEPNPMTLLAYAIARPEAPLIVWIHSEVLRPKLQYKLFYEPLLEIALRRAMRIVVASPPMLNLPALARYRDKCVVIPYGLERGRYRLSGVTATRMQAIRANRTSPIVLFVGRLVPYKGMDVLLRAVTGLDALTVVIGRLVSRLRRARAAVGQSAGGLRDGAARGDALRSPGDQYRAADRDVVGQRARTDRRGRQAG